MFTALTPAIGPYLVSDQQSAFGVSVETVLMGSIYRMSIVGPMNKALSLDEI